jgi:UPF0716 protein FxsA
VAVLLVLLFILVPIVEIYLIIQVGQVIGPWWTIAVLIGVSVLGSYLIKREGRRAWQALQSAMSSGRLPDRELIDGGLLLVGGTLLLTPGFMTDIFGLFFVLPFTRPLARRLLTRYVTRKFLGAPRTGHRPGPDSVVRGEVVD